MNHSPFLLQPSSFQSGSRYSAALRRYFRSGWAFLIPYLAAYLLYAWLKWPVNTFSPGLPIPPLLHVFWVIHLVHLTLGSYSLYRWWHDLGRFDPLSSTLLRLAPWALLAMFFWIPGVYLEFPADPWHHYTRINEWAWHQLVTEHTYWKRYSSFLSYSVIGWMSPPALQLKGFDAYYTGCCLLLSWQYYRIARLIGLSTRSSFLFVILNSLTFGNNIFGFFRYYGMSTTLFAQLGAVALVCLALQAVQSLSAKAPTVAGNHSTPAGSSQLAGYVGAALSLVLLIAFNHIQGLAITTLGITAVLVWHLIKWRRSSAGWLALIALLLSIATILWFPRNTLLEELYRTQRWLTPWYSFNIFEPTAPAFRGVVAIAGIFGLVNMLAGLWLLRNNHIAGWLTVIPYLALCIPCLVIPIATILAGTSSLEGGYIIIFHRILLGIPSGLALVVLFSAPTQRDRIHADLTLIRRDTARYGSLGFLMLILSLTLLVTVPSQGSFFNRFFHVLMKPPDDLMMNHVTHSTSQINVGATLKLPHTAEELILLKIERGSILTTPGIGYVLNATGSTLIAGTRKWMTWPTTTPPSANTNQSLNNLRVVDRTTIHALPFWPIPHLYSSTSLAGYLSTQWLNAEVALEHATQKELYAPSQQPVQNRRTPQIWMEWKFYGGNGIQYVGRGPDTNQLAPPVENRGRLNKDTPEQRIRIHDQITLRPVMRTLDGNAWQIIYRITGPDFQLNEYISATPNPLGGDRWLYDDRIVHFVQPGRYDVEITGHTHFPEGSMTVQYQIIVTAADDLDSLTGAAR